MFSSAEIQALNHITSTARLSSYRNSLGTTTTTETYGAYMWSCAVSAAFSPLIQALEICFRNSLNNAISQADGNDWFEKWSTNAANDLRRTGTLKPNQKSEGERLVENAKNKISKRGSFAWQRVLAEMSLGFWVDFLTAKHWDVNQRTKLWPNYLSAVFPNAPSHLYAHGALHSEFKGVLDLRNRIHHQEPLWKHHSVNTLDDALLYLQSKKNECTARLNFISPEQLLALQCYGVIAAIDELCSKTTFNRFVGRHEHKRVYVRAAKKDLNFIAKNLSPEQSLWLISDTSKQPKLVLRHASRRFF